MMTNDERQTMDDGRQIRKPARWAVGGGRWAVVFVLLTIVLLLAGCAAIPSQSDVQAPTGGGSFSPEAVAQSFFEDLGTALQDRKLADEQQRSAWVERLAGYF